MKKILILILMAVIFSLSVPIVSQAYDTQEDDTQPPTQMATYFDMEILPVIKTFVASASAVLVVLIPIIRLLSKAKKSNETNNSRLTDLTNELSDKNSVIVNLKSDIVEIKRLVEMYHKEENIVRMNCPTCIASGTAEKIVEAQNESKNTKS